MSEISPINVCESVSYLNSVDQKTRFKLFHIPPQRYDSLARSPYILINPTTGQPYTKFDIDMRRKSEILKYSSSRMSTQTNSLTRSQRYSQVINGKYQRRSFSQEFLNTNIVNGAVDLCPPGTIIKKPSSASGVPGRSILLYEDPSIPLYNLKNSTSEPYAIINQELDQYKIDFNYSSGKDIENNGLIMNNILHFFSFL
jgi:hypothetical protein